MENSRGGEKKAFFFLKGKKGGWWFRIKINKKKGKIKKK